MAIFELYEGGILGIFVSKTLNGDHSTHGSPFSLFAETFISVNANNLTET